MITVQQHSPISVTGKLRPIKRGSLADKVHRIHAFFGEPTGMDHLEQLALRLMALGPDLSLAWFPNYQAPPYRAFWRSHLRSEDDDQAEEKKAEALDAWLCTVHWWAWKAKQSPLHTRPQVVFEGTTHTADHTDPALVTRPSFSSLGTNVFAATAATIDLFLRFLDVPPDLDPSADYPPEPKPEPAAAPDKSTQIRIKRLRDDLCRLHLSMRKGRFPDESWEEVVQRYADPIRERFDEAESIAATARPCLPPPFTADDPERQLELLIDWAAAGRADKEGPGARLAAAVADGTAPPGGNSLEGGEQAANAKEEAAAGGDRPKATPKTDASLIYQADGATFYNIPKSVLSKGAKKKPGQPGYLWSGHDGSRVFYRKKDLATIARSRKALGRASQASDERDKKPHTQVSPRVSDRKKLEENAQAFLAKIGQEDTESED